MRKKLFGIVLSLMLVAAMIPSMAFAANLTPIVSIDATIKAPVAGEKPSYAVSFVSDPADSAKLATLSVYWKDREDLTEEDLTNVDWYYWDESITDYVYKWRYIDPNSDYTFEAGERYAVDIYVDAKDAYYINNATVARINGVEHNKSIWDDNFYFENDGFGCISAEWTLPAATTPDGGTTQPTTPTDKPSTDKPVSDKSPKTGDNANMAPWIALMAIAAVAGTGTVLYRRKNTVK